MINENPKIEIDCEQTKYNVGDIKKVIQNILHIPVVDLIIQFNNTLLKDENTYHTMV